MNALLISDNPHDEALVGHALRLAGLNVSTGQDMRTAIARWTDRPADLLVVTAHLADPVGTIREVRRVAVAPLVVIVDAVSEDIHCAMLDAGADWVITRPFSMRLLVCYIRVLMRGCA